MKIERTLIAGGFGLALISSTLAYQSKSFGLNAPDFQRANVSITYKCPNTDYRKASEDVRAQPIGSLSLVLL